MKIKFIFHKDLVGFRFGNFGFYINLLKRLFRTYDTQGDETHVRDYYWNPLKNYKKKIEQEITDKYLITLKKKYPEIFSDEYKKLK